MIKTCVSYDVYTIICLSHYESLRTPKKCLSGYNDQLETKLHYKLLPR